MSNEVHNAIKSSHDNYFFNAASGTEEQQQTSRFPEA